MTYMTYIVARLIAACIGLLLFVAVGVVIAVLRARSHANDGCLRFRSHPASWSLVGLSGSMGVVVMIGMLSQGADGIWVPFLMIVGAVWLGSVIARDVAVDALFVYQNIGSRRLASVRKSSINEVRKAVFGAVLRGDSGSVYVHGFLMRKRQLLARFEGAPEHVVASLRSIMGLTEVGRSR